METDKNSAQGKKPSFFPSGIYTWLAVIALIWVVMAVIGSKRPPSSPASNPAEAGPIAEAPVQDANIHFFQFPLEKTASALEEARSALASETPDVQAAGVALDQANDAVGELTGYYLPLTEARDHLVHAYWEQLAGQEDLRDESLAAAANQLTWIVENGSAFIVKDTEELLTILNSLEMHKQADKKFTGDLRTLCGKVQEHLVRAPLKLEEPVGNGDSAAATS